MSESGHRSSRRCEGAPLSTPLPAPSSAAHIHMGSEAARFEITDSLPQFDQAPPKSR